MACHLAVSRRLCLLLAATPSPRGSSLHYCPYVVTHPFGGRLPVGIRVRITRPFRWLHVPDSPLVAALPFGGGARAGLGSRVTRPCLRWSPSAGLDWLILFVAGHLWSLIFLHGSFGSTFLVVNRLLSSTSTVDGDLIYNGIKINLVF